MTTSEDLNGTHTHNRSVLRVSAILACANLVTLFFGLVLAMAYADQQAYEGQPYPQDILFPFALTTWGLALANGGVLAVWPRSRQTGAGILLGAGIAVFLLVSYVGISLTMMHQ